jgi:type I site-specific restriction-modification system R (restriction) subunit
MEFGDFGESEKSGETWESKIGTITSVFEHFGEWKRIEDENKIGDTLLDTMIQGTCEKSRLIDILEKQISELENVDMAVVISEGQDEIKKFGEKNLDIRPHKKRTTQEKLDVIFKDSKSKLKIVFVCSKWREGFDVPSLSTIYLDKPMKNHSLMQTIARANRVYGDKP